MFGLILNGGLGRLLAPDPDYALSQQVERSLDLNAGEEETENKYRVSSVGGNDGAVPPTSSPPPPTLQSALPPPSPTILKTTTTNVSPLTPQPYTPGTPFTPFTPSPTKHGASHALASPPPSPWGSPHPESRLTNDVLSACYTTAYGLTSPTSEWDVTKQVLTLCTKPQSEKTTAKVLKKVKANPSLLEARATNLAPLINDGYTLLLTAVSHGNLTITRALLELSPELIQQKTLAGQGCLHLAVKHPAIVEYLLASAMTDPPPKGVNAPIDLSGVTPAKLAWSKGQKNVARQLLEDGDWSVLPILPSSPRLSLMPYGEVGRGEVPGWRARMEDAATVSASYVGVYDGHGGSGVSELLSSQDMLAEDWKSVDARTREGFKGQGSTACVVDFSSARCLNVGDSKAVAYGGDGSVTDLSPEHSLEGDRAALERAEGVTVKEGRVWKGKDSLAMSRAFGDWEFKGEGGGGVSCERDETPLPEGWEWVVVACDGLWDTVTAEKAWAAIREGGGVVDIADRLTRLAIGEGSEDNVSVVVVRRSK